MAGRIACVGEVMLDVVVTTADRHGPIRVRPGGTPVNAALAAGGGALVVGRVGDDAAGSAIRAALPHARLAVDPALPTGTFVELADGTVFADRGASAALSLEDVLPLEADAVLVSGYCAIAADVLERSEARWRAVTATPVTTALPDGANIVFANEAEAERLDLAGYEIVVVTRGALGAEVRRAGRIELLAPSGLAGTGAGDALAGAFLAGL